MSILRRMLRAKIHRAIVTDANLDYEGSITIPPSLLQATDLRDYEAVCIWNVTRGTRFETYAIRGENETDICVNGAAAHLAGKGDIVIIAAFAEVPEEKLSSFKPKIIFVDSNNKITEQRLEKPYSAESSSFSARSQ